MSKEVVRKVIHLASLSIPIFYYFSDRTTLLAILIPFSIISLFIDIGRYYIPSVAKSVNRIFGSILRDHERESGKLLLSGATYVVLSATICALVFPKIVFITAFSILIISDSAGALLGRRFGRHTFIDKSLEGSLAFFVTGCVVVLVSPKITDDITEYLIGFVAALVAAVIEAMSVRLHVDDNFSVPLSAGLVMLGGYYSLLSINPYIGF